MITLEASKKPLEDLDKISPPNQSPQRRMYRQGYEEFFELMPVMSKHDKFLEHKTRMSRENMESLAKLLF